jgi:hypothetical protein
MSPPPVRSRRSAQRADARVVSALFLATGSRCLFDLYRQMTLIAGG